MSNKNETEAQSQNLLSIFSNLSSLHKQQILAQTTQLSIKAGQTLIQEGDKAETLFVKSIL